MSLISGKYGHFWPLESRFLMRKIEKKGPMVWISKFTDTRNPHIISDNLAKAESLLIFVRQKMCKGPMCTMQPALLGSVSQEFLEIGHILKRLLRSTWVEWSAQLILGKNTIFIFKMSDPSPIIGYACHWLTHSLTHSCLVDLMAVNDTNCLMMSQQLLKAVKSFLRLKKLCKLSTVCKGC